MKQTNYFFCVKVAAKIKGSPIKHICYGVEKEFRILYVPTNNLQEFRMLYGMDPD